MKATTISSAILILFGTVTALIFGKQILFPFLFALLIYFLIRSIRRFIDKNHFVRQRVPGPVKNIISSLIIFSILFFLGELLVVNSQHLASDFSQYEANIDRLKQEASRFIGEDLSSQLAETIKRFEIKTIINPLLNSVTGFMGSFMMAVFYLLFLFIEESNFRNKLHILFRTPEKYTDIRELLNNIEHSITHYVGLKTLISILSAAICFVLLFFFGVNSPLLWAFLVFVMNFIPVIGPLLAVMLPSLFAMIQFGEITSPLILFFILGTAQTLMGNLVEPKIMGDSLNVSPLVALFALAFWGAIWGILGMVLSVPITVIIIILLAHFPGTRPIAVLLSQNGKV